MAAALICEELPRALDAPRAIQKLQPRTCFHCGKVFYRTGGNGRTGRDAGKCCSRECGFAWQAITRAAHIAPSYSVDRPLCAACAKRYTSVREGTLYCSKECRSSIGAAITKARLIENYKPARFQCRECGSPCVSQYGDSRRSFCSKACGKRSAKRVSRKVGKLRLRAAVVERVDPSIVFARDKWRCHLCGIKAPMRLRGTFEHNAPELDHIVPIAKGGEHSYRNTACACRKCNIEKSDTIRGQFRLFG